MRAVPIIRTHSGSLRSPSRAPRIPGDIVLEPDEHVLVATKPLAFWTPVVPFLLAVWAVAFAYWANGDLGRFTLVALVAVAATVVLGLAWLRWRGRWFLLTSRRVIVRWGVLDRNQAAILLDRIQDVTLQRPFPLSYLRGYGVLQLETAGEHSSERLSGGVHRIAMEHADEFHRRLTDALTPA